MSFIRGLTGHYPFLPLGVKQSIPGKMERPKTTRGRLQSANLHGRMKKNGKSWIASRKQKRGVPRPGPM